MTPPRKGQAWWPLVAVTFAVFMGFSAVLPSLPDDVHHRLHGSDGLLGVVVGAFPVFALAGRFIAGWSADHRGRRVTLLVGIGTCAVASGMFLLQLPAGLLVTARGLQGLGDALTYTAAVAWVVDLVPEDERTGAVALLGGGVWGGYAAGPLVGVVLGDLRSAGAFALGAALLALPLSLLMADPPPHAGPRESVPAALIARVVAWPGLGIGLVNLSYAAVIGFLVVHLHGRGGHGALVLALFSATVLLGRVVVVPLAQRLGLTRGLAVATSAVVLGTVVMGESRSLPLTATAAVLFGLGYCLPYPVMASLVTGRLPAAGRARALGALVAIYDACVGLGAVLLGQISDAAGTTWVFRTSAIVGVVGAVISVSVIHHARSVTVVTQAGGPVPDA